MKKTQGFTLIEVILSIALLAIIAVVFLGVFNIGNKNIIKAGHRTDDIMNLEEKINDEIRSPSNNDLKDLTIYFKNIGITKTIQGYFITEINDKGVEITTFIPRPGAKKDSK